jgi:hypothetical protein
VSQKGSTVSLGTRVPAAVAGMLEAAIHDREVTRARIRHYQHEAAAVYWDMTPLLSIAVIAFMAMRYVSRGIGETELLVLSGVGSALFWGLIALARRLGRGNALALRLLPPSTNTVEQLQAPRTDRAGRAATRNPEQVGEKRPLVSRRRGWFDQFLCEAGALRRTRDFFNSIAPLLSLCSWPPATA